MAKFNPELKREYEDTFAGAAIRPQHLGEIDAAVERIFAGMSRYREAEHETGVPAHVIGIIHLREASLNFNTHLHNGDPLTGHTWHVPKDRPPTGSPPFSWVESAVDALTMPGQALHTWKDWSIGGIAYVLERYNGFGYRNRGINSPYLWGYTTAYERGLYVADGRFDPEAINRNPGGMALLKRMVERGLVGGKPTKPEKPPRRVEQAITAFNKAALRLQTQLDEHGFYKGQIDGDFGEASRRALLAYLRKWHP